MNSDIKFFELPDFSITESDLCKWLFKCAGSYGVTINQLYFNFVSPQALLDLNQTHLDHDTDTDIITFSYTSSPDLSAEIYISTEMMIKNAKEFNVSPENELLRLLSHGFLHTIGYSDKTTKDKYLMTTQEDHCISLFHVKQSNHV